MDFLKKLGEKILSVFTPVAKGGESGGKPVVASSPQNFPPRRSYRQGGGEGNRPRRSGEQQSDRPIRSSENGRRGSRNGGPRNSRYKSGGKNRSFNKPSATGSSLPVEGREPRPFTRHQEGHPPRSPRTPHEGNRNEGSGPQGGRDRKFGNRGRRPFRNSGPNSNRNHRGARRPDSSSESTRSVSGEHHFEKKQSFEPSRERKSIEPIENKNTPSVTPPPVEVREELVGIVTHYFAGVNAAAIKVSAPQLSVGDMLRFRGATTDFSMKIKSMQINRSSVTVAARNAEIGIEVTDKVREGDEVYRVG